MSIKLSGMSGVEPWKGGSILGPGKHYVQITGATEGETSNGNPQVELDYEAVDGSGTIREWLVLVPATYGKAKALLIAVGLDSDQDEFDFPTEALVGKKLTILNAEEPDYKDPSKTRTRVQGHEAGNTTNVSADGTADFSGLPPAKNDGLPW